MPIGIYKRNSSWEERFWSNVEPFGECLNWVASKYRNGYGQSYYKGKNYSAHRILMIRLYGDLGSDEYICHTCDNRSCVNPSHLYIGSQKDNINDMWLKGRHKNSKKNLAIGSKMHKENGVWVKV